MMLPNRSIPNAAVIPELAYIDVLAAAKWLCEHFGFRERLRIADHRVQLSVGEGAVIVTQRDPASGPVGSAHSVLVRIENIDEHYRKTVSKGVRIIHPIKSHPYGERQYTAEDFDGHVWKFSQTLEDVDPASWGGTLMKQP
ncbi:MAG TPA: VOC family protein [Verrucomicrobiae bacterium]|nr:VOC family protein [Verrucomicrobiae bacterium]